MFLETMEARRLMSVTAVNATILTDRLQTRVDLLKFKVDAISCALVMHADGKALKADGVGTDETLAPLFATLKVDVKAMRTQLAADRLNQRLAVLKDQVAIVKDLLKIRADLGNPTAVTADRAQLLADRIQLQTDEIAGLNARLATRQAAHDKIFADVQAISDAVASDAGASEQLKTDVQKFVTDGTNCLNVLETDLQTLVADRTKLASDLTALQSS